MGQHNVRVDDLLWSAAMAKTRTEGTTITAVLTRALMDYTGASEVAGIMILPDPRMPEGLAAVTSGSGRPVFMKLPDPRPPADGACKHERAVKGWCRECQTGGHWS